MNASELSIRITADTKKIDASLERVDKTLAALIEQANLLRGVNAELDAAADAVIASLERMPVEGETDDGR